MNHGNVEVVKLRKELDDLAERLEKMEGGFRFSDLREALDKTREKIKSQWDSAYEAGQKASRQVQDYVQDNPWKIAGAMLLVGIGAGLLLNRSRRE